MRISQKTEWILIAALIAYIAFTPGLAAVRQLLSTDVGKALGLAAVVAVWKYVSPIVALLLTVSLVRCASMREYMESGAPPTSTSAPPNTYCPDNHSFDSGQCKNMTTGQTIPATVCLTGQTWDGVKCVGGSTPTPSTPPPAQPPPPSTSSTTTKQPFTLMSAAPVGGVQPDIKEKENFAPF
jgi:hypothetical protein